METSILTRLGPQENDIGKDVLTRDDLIKEIVSSGRLFRKVLEEIILNQIRAHLDDQTISRDHKFVSYFSKRHRTGVWKDFKEDMNLKVPGLKLTNIAIGLIFLYLSFYVYALAKIFFDNWDVIFLSGLPVGSLIIFGATIPIIPFVEFGRRKLPAENFDELIDKIIKLNLGDLLADNKKLFYEILANEIE
jgi:hypothetical protein